MKAKREAKSLDEMIKGRKGRPRLFDVDMETIPMLLPKDSIEIIDAKRKSTTRAAFMRDIILEKINYEQERKKVHVQDN